MPPTPSRIYCGQASLPCFSGIDAHVYMHHVQAARSSKARRMERHVPGFCLLGPTLSAPLAS